jgi:hypothetical protein
MHNVQFSSSGRPNINPHLEKCEMTPSAIRTLGAGSEITFHNLRFRLVGMDKKSGLP